MSGRDTSLAAFHALEDSGALQDQERQLMIFIHRLFPYPDRFTRKELTAKTGWTINRITGRVFSLVEKRYLTEFPETRDGGHLLSVRQSQPSPVAPPYLSHRALPRDEAAVTVPQVAPQVVHGSAQADGGNTGTERVVAQDSAPACAAPDVLRVDGWDYKGRPMVRYVEGYGPGWPPDQNHLHRKQKAAA